MSAGLYDTFPYRSRAYPECHVDRMAVVAQWFGRPAAAVQRCRVLEVGCADAGNLAPMAELLPDARFVGVDLSERAIRDGRAAVAAAGLTNVELRHGDALRVDDGPYDYVIAHGVFSWIPADARPKLLARIADWLAPSGVAMVSYDVLPGWYHRKIIREFIELHRGEADDPGEMVEQARSLLGFLHGAADPSTLHGQSMKVHVESLLGASDQYLVHGLLAHVSDPIYLLQFVDAAAAAGLEYLGDIDLGVMTGEGVAAAGRSMVASTPTGWVEREALFDTLTMRTFRHSLLVRGPGGSADRRLTARALGGLWLASPARRVNANRYAYNGRVMDVTDPVIGVGLERLTAAWPSTVRFDDWCGAVVETTGATLDAVASVVWTLIAADWVTVHPRDLAIAGSAGNAPRASRWARRCAVAGAGVPDRMHRTHELNPGLRWLLARCDGMTTRGELSAALAASPLIIDGDRDTWVEWGLQSLAGRGFFADDRVHPV